MTKTLALMGAFLLTVCAGTVAAQECTSSGGINVCKYHTHGTAAAGLAVDNVGDIWITNGGSNTLTKMALSNGAVLGVYLTNITPVGVAVLGGTVFVAESGDGTIGNYRISDGKLIKRFPVGVAPSQLLVAGNYLWATDIGTGNVLKIDPASGQTLLSVHPGSSPDKMTYYGGSIWVTTPPTGFVKIDAATGTWTRYYTYGQGEVTGITTDGAWIWLIDSLGVVYQFDPVNIYYVSETSTGFLNAQTIMWDGNSCLWACGIDNDFIVRINPATLVTTVAPIPAGYLDQPLMMAPGVAGNLWVSDNGLSNMGVTNFSTTF